MLDSNKILVICGCSKEKLSNPAPAQYIYQGRLFKKVKKLVNYKKLNFKILSAKYGLVDPMQKIKPYNKTIRNKNEIIELRKKINPKMTILENEYSLIILVMGKKYREVFRPLFKTNKYKMIYSSQGIGSLLVKIDKYIKSPLPAMLEDLESCEIS